MKYVYFSRKLVKEQKSRIISKSFISWDPWASGFLENDTVNTFFQLMFSSYLLLIFKIHIILRGINNGILFSM